jgi:hypothetical protein
MYLTAERYLSDYSPPESKALRNAITQLIANDVALINSANSAEFSGVNGIRLQAAYWRKANAIHNWFVQHTQDGVDDCRTTYVSREQLRKLVEECQRALDTREAPESLQPTAGFFFGSTDIDEYYFEYLQSTVDQITAALQLPNNYTFNYQSSW